MTTAANLPGASGPRTRPGATIALVTSGIIAALLIAECGLRVISVVRPARRTVFGAGPTLLFEGDSNTYGLYVDADESYPARVAALTHRRVVNLGYPGTNSSRVRNRIADDLASVRPIAVFVMVGVNDFWTAPEPLPGERETWGDWAWRRSRVWQLATMLRYGFPLADRPAVGVPHEDRLAENLRAIAAAARAAQVPLTFITYPATGLAYTPADEALRRAARDTGTALIDLTPTFTARCPTVPCALLLQDHHPTPTGHDLAAHLVAEEISQEPRASERHRDGATTSAAIRGPSLAARTRGSGSTKRTMRPSIRSSSRKIA